MRNYHCTMDGNKIEAIRYFELSKLYLEKKDYYNAWKYTLKSIKLFPMYENKCLMRNLNSLAESLKQRSSKRKQPENLSNCSILTEDYLKNEESNISFEPKSKKFHPSIPLTSTYSTDMFKQINKDESYRCIEKAEDFIKRNQLDMAEKLLHKSIKLFFISKAEKLLEKITYLKELNKPKYSSEQIDLVKKLKNSKNYYTMLGININATESEIKKAYKKLALLIHPDKNPAPGSGEVFIAIGNAVKVLCNQRERSIYDSSLNKSSNTKRKTQCDGSSSTSKSCHSEYSFNSYYNYYEYCEEDYYQNYNYQENVDFNYGNYYYDDYYDTYDY
ncbi:dnaJ homolog subfamily B member 14-like isoform X2 [Daktulosphaira vitifoliae]|uniref:dnaJ homolog subfamily B member 14-like isoform X2 n=2 Tax=Daktulosphaira vitifoliae TaxID=58002 RepID=UPI0021AA8339|nr:dnaJ homolog subfamily B member 14-like isoform X2 [Daktulosphaira vitifoliae]